MKQHVRSFTKLDAIEAEAISKAFLNFANGMPIDTDDVEIAEQVKQLATELGRAKTVSYLIGRLGDYQKAYTDAIVDQVGSDETAKAFYNGVQTGMNFMAGVGMVLDGRIDSAGLIDFLEATEASDADKSAQ
ncbi:hypothetical protein [Periweissella fabalis]|uniref:Uncharacterized protein n=1 Tax=Periweissella fabalis TaxID=1070421 RepID=A0A7X6S3M6_9LACO|nr:hypothetical protein [Periweissella fabalis]MCM0599813.1 hypothetical protein [Periweissella fabalis]NKZ24381.1 hypothetical protein [Periweissella fabalis]